VAANQGYHSATFPYWGTEQGAEVLFAGLPLDTVPWEGGSTQAKHAVLYCTGWLAAWLCVRWWCTNALGLL
jgi:hypothetical protein